MSLSPDPVAELAKNMAAWRLTSFPPDMPTENLFNMRNDLHDQLEWVDEVLLERMKDALKRRA